MLTIKLSKFQIAETKTFEKSKKKIDEKLIVVVVDFKHRQKAYD